MSAVRQKRQQLCPAVFAMPAKAALQSARPYCNNNTQAAPRLYDAAVCIDDTHQCWAARRQSVKLVVVPCCTCPRMSVLFSLEDARTVDGAPATFLSPPLAISKLWG